MARMAAGGNSLPAAAAEEGGQRSLADDEPGADEGQHEPCVAGMPDHPVGKC